MGEKTSETVIEQAIIFVEADPLLQNWLQKFKERETLTYQQYAYEIMRYFAWIREVKGWNVTPEQLINDHIQCRKNENVVTRKKHLFLLKEYLREFKEASESAKHLIASAVSSFYNSCEAPLTTEKGAFGGVKKHKHEYKQFGVEDARKIIDYAPQREKTCMLMMLQGFMGIGELLKIANYQWEEIKPQLEDGKDPIKIGMPAGRKGGPSYWTYITTDAIHELKKYITERGEPQPSEPIFISATGKQLYPQQLNDAFRRAADKARLIEYDSSWRKRAGKHKRGHRYPIKIHMFRKLAKSEASVAGRGIDQRYVEFFMGHTGGIRDLVGVGGVYDRSPELHEPIFEAEYRKIAPYVNIYTGVPAAGPVKEPTDEEILEAVKKTPLEQRRLLWTSISTYLPIRRLKRLEPDIKPLLEEVKNTATNGGRADCQRIVEESELAQMLAQGWRVAAVLPSGRIVVSNIND